MNAGRFVFLVLCLTVISANGEEKRYDQVFPKTDFRGLLEFIVNVERKSVVVTDPAVFQIETSYVLPQATISETRKVLRAVLLINGYELVEKKDELHLTKVLSQEQCTAMMNALGADGDFPRQAEHPIARPRVIRKRDGKVVHPPHRVIVRKPE